MPGANLIAELAVIFLLFTIGLELSFQTLKKNWKLIVTSGLGQVVLTVAFFRVPMPLGVEFTLATSIAVGVFDFVELISHCHETVD